MPLWPGTPPAATTLNEAEVAGTVVDDATGRAKPVGGKPWTYVNYVSRPTLTVYSPQRNDTGAAVVVFPGGGYNVLAIDLEGTEACDWLTSKGITCVLVKYRVPCAKVGPYRECPPALQDAQRAIGLVRHQAVQWQIDPRKIGVLGFSAGGHIVAAVSTRFGQRVYPSVDDADRESSRPDFAIALYPGHMVASAGDATMNPAIRVTAQTPPTMIVAASDDPTDPVQNSIVYGEALKKAGVPFELHIFEKGGHGFGFRPVDGTASGWPALAERWLSSIGVLTH
jgi:acetyl esterase/lipase